MTIALKNANFAKSTLGGNITDVATVLTVASAGDAALFPSTGTMRCVIWSGSLATPMQDTTREFITMTFSSGVTFDPVVRGRESTSGKAWSTGDCIALVISAGKIDEVESEITTHEALTITAHGGIAPSTAAPVGSILMWPTDTAPTGWLECKGDSLVRTGTYADLFAVLSTLYGTADSTHFNIPDYRGRVPRAWDHAKALDPDRATRTVPSTAGATLTAGDHVGTEQAEDIKSHAHNQMAWNAGSATTIYIAHAGANATTPADTGLDTDVYGGNETRPINTNLMFIIRYA